MRAPRGDLSFAVGEGRDRPALLLTPSRGLGGGIERYVEALEWAFFQERIEYRRVDPQHSGATGHARMMFDARTQMRALAASARLIVAHRSLLPAARLLACGGPPKECPSCITATMSGGVAAGGGAGASRTACCGSPACASLPLAVSPLAR